MTVRLDALNIARGVRFDRAPAKFFNESTGVYVCVYMYVYVYVYVYESGVELRSACGPLLRAYKLT